MKIRIRHIVLIFTLLLLGGMTNEAWGKITYHILSLPMTTHQRNGTNNIEGDVVSVFKTNVRVEVLRVVSSDLHVELPFEYKSPLVTTYHYYAADKITRSANPEQLYGYNNTTYYFYTINGSSANEDVPGNQLTAGDACDDNIHIYVTYDYDPATSTLDLSTDLLDPNSGSHKTYNIHLKDRMLVLNQKRQNRPGAVLDGKYTSEQLSSNEFEWITSAGINNGDGYRHFAFKFGGNDPYNVTIFTAFDKPYTFRETGKDNFYTTYKKDRDKYTQKDVYKEYRGASIFSLMKSEITANMWVSSEAHIQWQDGGGPDAAISKTVPGYFKGPNDSKSTFYEMSPIFNSFAILNHKSGEGWALAGSKMNTGTNNWQPKADNGQIQYLDYKDNGNTTTIVYKADASACKVDVYEVKEYVFRVVTPFGSNVDAVAKWSDYDKSKTITESMIPDELKRKYVIFTGNFYGDAAHTQTVATFEEAQNPAKCATDASGRPIIYVDYEVVGAPFTAITAANKITGYTSATWYELTDAASSDGGKKIKWDATNTVYKNSGGASEYNKESEFAFIGDPYELRIINRALTVSNSGNVFVGSSSRTTATNLTNLNDPGDGTETAGFKWEIPYDETLGSFTLREFGSSDAYWQWNTIEGNNIQYSTSASTRIKVMEIGKLNYTFKVVDLAGNIAIQASAEYTPFTTLTGEMVGYSIIPSTIRSPYIADETITFFSTYSGGGRGNLEGGLTELPGINNSVIYVAYTTTRLNSKSINLSSGQQFNVKLNNEYLYWDETANKVMGNASPSDANLESKAFLWHLRNRDPYAMMIENMRVTEIAGYESQTESIPVYDTDGLGGSTSSNLPKGKFVSASWADDATLSFVDRSSASVSRFIAMLSNAPGVYEVMAATGNDTYFHIGRATEDSEVKIYSTSTYAHGADQLRFVLEGTTVIYYHLIDKSGKEIFRNEISSKNARLALPAEYWSPLVASYHYYAGSDVDQTNGADAVPNTADDIFTLHPAPTDLSEAGGNNHIYVFYDVSDFGFGTSHPYVLKFLQPYATGYFLEDGADKLTSSKIQAVYPYCNGDGNLNIYGQPMNEEQMNGGSSTRPRWIWYFESANSDPYHVKVHSRSTISFNGTHTTYFQTQAIHFNQDENANLQHVVTGANFPGISQVAATEYMVLGTTGRYKLVTTSKIAADLNGDGDTDDDGENERRTVNSFEQYWKTYNMIKQHVLGIDCKNDETYKDAFSTVRSTFVIPDELRSTLATRLESLGIGGNNWHSYNAIANGLRWNGFNNDGKANTKTVEELEHWFQTFDMGDGTFDIESADIPAVLVLLDRHGWEIMRKPLPTGSNDPQREEKLAALRAFDSPMVKEYKFYNNATKASNCHKYIIRLDNNKLERDTISLNGKHYTSSSLADLPPLTAKGVMSSGAINDQFVTYTVKEEYEKSYQYSLVYSETKDANNKVTGYTITSETGTPSAFIVLQNDKYAQANGAAIDGKTVQSGGLSDMIINPDSNADSNDDDNIDEVNLWYIQPNLDIDNEMGIPWSSTIGNSNEPYMENETKVKYKDKTGFDPYNIQLKNVQTDRFFTTHMTQSVLDGGAYTGVYSGEGGSTDVTLADACSTPVASPESYDHSTLQMTNQTFMAVQDENGNMQLMPRFDHTKRINVFTTLEAPLTAPEGDHSGAQTTQIVRPLVFDYHIIDNDGNTALRYKAGGEFYPEIPGHFKSPLATDFKYYYGTEKGTPTASTAEAWENAEVIKQKTASDDSDMNTQVAALTVPGDYYFKIGSDPSYTYKMVTVGTEITGAFAAAGIQESSDILVRYSYDEDYDTDHDNILQGRWMTIKLNNLDVQAQGTVVAANDATSGTGVSLYTGSKPVMDDADAKRWQWKFLPSPSVSSSPYFVAPDPYAVQIFNRNANYDANPIANPNKMGTPIKISDKDRFVLLAHPDGDYALAAAGDGLTYSFVDGTSMTIPSTMAASVNLDEDFTTSPSYDIADGKRVQFINDVTITYTYKVITNDGIIAASQTQDESMARSHDFTPFLPEDIQTPLLNQSDYLYYGTASVSDGITTVVPDSKLSTLYGLYDDVVYVRYNTYDELKSPYKVPNAKDIVDSHVARASNSNDASLGLNENLLYNIIWYNDEMMKSTDDGTAVESESGQSLQATAKFEWQLEGNDPYAIKIKSIGATSGETKKYIHESATPNTCELSTTPTTFMILNRDGYDYGVLAKTGTPVVGGSASMLSSHGEQLTTSDPTHFIIFALATYKVIYHLMIKETGAPVVIPYKGSLNGNVYDPDYKILDGTSQRDLTTGGGTTYQLGTNIYSIVPEPGLGEVRVIGDSLYCVDAGCISLGDVLKVPDQLYRPNVVYKYFIEGVYNSSGTAAVADMNAIYQGTERRTMGNDAGLLGTTVLINIIYTFDGDLETNAGEGFVTSVGQNKWYTFETSGSTPYLAHYTNAWGLQSMAGRATRYTNDYLWTPLGDPYGFKMYNRYMCVNSAKPDYVMTTPDLTDGRRLMMGEPGVTDKPAGAGEGKIPQGNEIYELLASSADGYFNVHPLYDTSMTLFVKRGTDDFAELSTTPTPWTFGLDETLFAPYYERAGYVGALTTTPETGGKAKYEEASEEEDPARRLMRLQDVVYNDANIVPYSPGYYRLHNQPGVSGISPVRYASGYLHETEKTAATGSTAIPMHFYSRKGVSTTFEGDGGLGTGFTETPATRGPIPVPATEYDPSTIFYISGDVDPDDPLDTTNPRSTLSTQGLYIKGIQNDDDHGDAVMTATVEEATKFSLMDIGAGVFLIHDGTVPKTRTYLHFSQSYEKSSVNMIYDLKYFHNSPTDDAKWCMEPANMQGLMVTTNSGGDGYYYTTFCAPYDVELPPNADGNTYYAYVCSTWNSEVIHPTKVPASAPYNEGKFVPATTPVLIRTNDISGSIKLTIPSDHPTTPALSCVFTGKYLEQLLTTEITSSDMVYSFGLPITGYGLITDSGDTNGNITDVLNKDQADTGVGFYINANPNKELSEETGLWTPNNRYVLHNKIYYRSSEANVSANARENTRGIEFVPVIFDDEEGGEEPEQNGVMEQHVGDNRVYDLQGRCVATEEQVKDGTWKERLRPGIYILNGRKIRK